MWRLVILKRRRKNFSSLKGEEERRFFWVAWRRKQFNLIMERVDEYGFFFSSCFANKSHLVYHNMGGLIFYIR
jgi:hypothetical protein